MTAAITASPHVNIATSGLISPAVPTQTITSVAKKSVAEIMAFNEKNIKTSNWAIACGAVAATITALAIATLQPIVIVYALPMAASLALHAYRGFSDASAKRKLARHLNAELDVVQKIDEYQLENRALLREITSLHFDLGNQTEIERTKQLTDLGNRLVNTLPDMVKSHNWVKRSISNLEPLTCDAELSDRLYRYTGALKFVVDNLRDTRTRIIDLVSWHRNSQFRPISYF